MKKFTLLLSLCLWGTVQAQDCTPPSGMYSQNFETAEVPALPECTSAINAGTGNSWITANNPGFGFESKTLVYSASPDPADAWFFNKGVELTAGVNYKISYRYGNNSVTGVESFEIKMGTATDVASATQSVSIHNNVTGAAPQTVAIPFFQPPATGTYYFSFHANSTGNQGELYIDDFIVEEMVCGMPENIEAGNITNNSATISWSPPSEDNIGIISVYQYALMTTDEPPADGTYHSELSINLTDLTAGTTYYVFTRTLCGLVWSDWTEPYIFITPPCAIVTLPYSMDFESATVPGLPACTSIVNAGEGNDWETVNNPGNGFENNTLQYVSNTETANTWFFTQGFELTAGTYYKVAYDYGNNSDITQENLSVTFGSAPSPATQEGVFASHPEITGGIVQTGGTDYFNVGEDGIYYFGFNAYSDANQGSLYIDNIYISELVCGIPEEVTVTAVTNDSATISWSEPTGGNGEISVYQYAIVTTDTPPDDGIYHPELSIDLTELSANTTYYVFTRSLCGPLWSDWTDAVIFTTAACETTEVPYILDFEDAELPAMPDCTTVLNAGEGNNWITVNNPGSGFEDTALEYSTDTDAANAWFFTRGIELEAGVFYKISYDFGNNSAEATESFKATLNSSPSPESVLFDFSDHPEVSGGEMQNAAFDFVNLPEGGIFYFGFNVYSEENQGSLYLDNFKVEEQVCGTPHSAAVDNITDTTATLTWEAPITGNTDIINVYQYTLQTNDTPPAEGSFSPTMEINFEDLEPETTYFVFIRAQCGPIWSDWVMTTFTTDEELGIDENNFKALKYFPNPVYDVLYVSNDLEIENIEIYTLTGQLVQQLKPESRNVEINMAALQAGSYFITLESGNETKRIKAIKQ